MWIAVGLVSACGDTPQPGGDPPGSMPVPTIDSEPTTLTNHPHAVFEFHADGVDAFTCALDHALSACTSPAAFDVGNGPHTFAVGSGARAAIDDGFATYSWMVDIVAPETRIDHAPPALDNSATETITFSSPDAVSFECAIDTGAFAACASPMSVTPGDGDHTFAVRAIDAAGNTDPTPATAAWTLDTAIVDTAITSGPDDGSTTTTGIVSFAFSSPVSPTTFECLIDHAAFVACTSPTVLDLPDGVHHFAVRAKDVHGVVDPSPATRDFTVDTTAPVVTLVSHPGNPTNLHAAAFTFTVDDTTATFECRVDEGGFAACTSPFSTTLPDGDHAFAVRAIDPIGNGSTVVAFDWTIDSLAPGVTITSGPSGPTKERTPVFEFTTTGSPVTVTCKLDGGAAAACTSPFTAPSLSDGSHQFVVTATDGAGNTGGDARSFSVDTRGPTVTFDTKPSLLWPLTYFDFTFHASEAATFECSLDQAAFAPCTSPATASGAGPGPGGGSHTFTVRATDALGNVGLDSATSWNFATSAVIAVTFDNGSTASSATPTLITGYSPPPSIATVTAVGGRSGLAARSPSYRYAGAKRMLSTATDHEMFASVWIRPRATASGVLWSNATASDGLTLSATAGGLRLSLLHGGTDDHLDVPVAADEWHLVVVTSRHGADGAELFVDAASTGVVGAGSGTTGFDDQQADDLVIGPMTGVDVDDLQIFPASASIPFICAILGSGEFDPGTSRCTNLARPSLELSFEGDFVDSGVFHLPVKVPEASMFVAGHLGSELRLTAPATDFSIPGFGTAASALTERTLTFLVDTSASTPSDVLLDFMSSTTTPSGGRVTYIKSQSALQFSFITTTNSAQQTTVTIGDGRHTVAIVEHVAAGSTASVDIFVDHVQKTLVFTSGALITGVNDRLGFASNAGSVIDEIRLWPRDLSAIDGGICRLGFGGRFSNPICVLP
jgi:hypothetical protein